MTGSPRVVVGMRNQLCYAWVRHVNERADAARASHVAALAAAPELIEADIEDLLTGALRVERAHLDVAAGGVSRCGCVQVERAMMLAALDAAISDWPYLLGDTMSAADLSICYVMRGYRRLVSESLPANAQAYFDRVTALPSYGPTAKADAETGGRLKG